MNRNSGTPDPNILLKQLEALSLRLDLEEAEVIASMPDSAVERELGTLTLNSALPQTGVGRSQMQLLESEVETAAKNEAFIGGQASNVSSSGLSVASQTQLKVERSASHTMAPVRAIARFFQFLSKTDSDVIHSPHCTKSTRMSRTSLGITVFLAGVAAFLSGSYALTTTFSGRPFVALILGFLYSCTIVTFYRELVGSRDRRGVWVRLPLAIIICFIVAVPLEMKFLEKRIDRELRVMNLKDNESALSRRNERLDELERRMKELQDSVDHYRAEVLNWESAAEAEMVGRAMAGRTGKAGAGPAFREAMRNREASAAMLSRYEAELKQYGEVQAEERRRINGDYNAMFIQQNGDFLARYEALNQLKSTSAAAATVSWGVRILFILIGLFPTLLKLSLPYNEYDAMLESRLRSAIQRIQALCNQLGQLVPEASRTPPVNSGESAVEV